MSPHPSAESGGSAAGPPVTALDPERWRRVAALLDEAFDLPAEGVAAWLDRECAGDPNLRAHVEALLAADRDAAERFLDAAALSPDALEALSGSGPAPAPAVAGQRVGPWRIVREIGRGGMGEVYLAERADGAFEQRVALKRIKRGLDTDEISRRFLRERQILARLQHPHIAHLVDGGVTEDGRPWFAMEYVEGTPITAWCDTRGASLEQRLSRFRTACEAVEHAHRSLVVHRDLKPSNIFVTEDGQVKLLDFGIGRLIEGDAVGPEVTLTGVGARPFTPQYAAPEQLRGEATTTATDIHGLGLVLYELLAGTPAVAETGSLEKIRRQVLEVEPPPPSAGRTAWRQELRGDLDHIVLMALRKEPHRRYPSVEALLADLARFQEGLPVRATPPSARYRLGKFLRRHRGAVVAGSLMTLLVVAGAVVALWQALAAALLVASLLGGLLISLAQARAARREARKADEVKRFLVGVFEVSDPFQARGESVTARELLDRGAQRIESALQDQPLVRAELLGVLGDLYAKLGLVEPGMRLSDRELHVLDSTRRPPLEARGSALRRRGNLLLMKGDGAGAEAVLREAVAAHRVRPGPRSADYAEDLDQLGAALRMNGELAEAEGVLRESLEIRRRALGAAGPAVAVSLNNLAVMAREAGRGEEAEALYRECLRIRREKLPPDHPDLCTTLNNLAILLRQLGRYDEAERLASESIALHLKVYGEDHPMTVAALNSRGAILLNLARFAEAEQVFRRIVAYWERHEGRQHPHAVATLNNLAASLREQGDLTAAEAIQREAVERWRAQFGDRHPSYAAGLVNLAAIRREQGEIPEAERHLEQALEIRVAAHGEDHAEVAHVIHNQALAADRAGDLRTAEERYRRALAMRERCLGADNPATAASRAGLASVARRLGGVDEARELLRQAEEVLLRTVPEGHPDRVLAARERAALGEGGS